jgi:pimeloyl-ACP methyl ester carboxylesterase
MKRLFLLAMMMIFASQMLFAEATMTVHLDDGTSDEYDIADISWIGFEVGEVIEAPANLRTILVEQQRVVLAWDEVEGATNYRLYRSTEEDGEYTQIYWASSNAYDDNGEHLTPGTTYYYKVRAENDEAISEYSGSLEVTTLEEDEHYIFYPSIEVNDSEYITSDEILIIGENFSINEEVTVKIVGNGIDESYSQTTTYFGDFSYEIYVDSDFRTGYYDIYAIDNETSYKTSKKIIYIKKSENDDDYFSIIEPKEGDEFLENRPITIQWQDFAPMYAQEQRIDGAKVLMSYDVYLTTDQGNTWEYLGDQTGVRYRGKKFTMGYTFSWNSDIENAAIMVEDYYDNTKVIFSDDFDIILDLTGNLIPTKQWDYSRQNPERLNTTPKGVAADGTSRIYLKLNNYNEDLTIESVEVVLSDGYSDSNDYEHLGKVMAATVTDQYSEEANDITSTTAYAEINGDECWFWYVSPDNYFRLGTNDKDEDYRTVKVTYYVTYTNGSEAVTEDFVRIIRPPLMLVHGLKSNNSTWDNFYFSGNQFGYFVDNRRWFSYAPNISPNGHFKYNATLVIFEIFTLLERVHNSGYAALKVDYVGHSMGGSVLRTAEQEKPAFYSGLGYHTYSTNVINKFITLNTPHFGSPLANMVEDVFLSGLNNYDFQEMLSELLWALEKTRNPKIAIIATAARFLIEKTVKYAMLPVWLDKDECSLLTIIEPDIEERFLLDKLTWLLAPAASDLRYNTGFKFHETNIPSSVIVGDLLAGDADLPDIEDYQWEMINVDEKFAKYFDLYMVAVNQIKADRLDKIVGSGIGKASKVVQYFHWLMIFYNITDFVLNSDGVVTVESQLSGLDRSEDQVKIFSGFQYYHSKINSRTDVANYVFDLLHDDINSSKFGSLPATPDHIDISSTPVGNLSQEDEIIYFSDFVTAPVMTITLPVDSTTVYIDSTLTINLTLSDTTGFNLLKVYFQNTTITDTIKANNYQFRIPVEPNEFGEQAIDFIAIYNYTDTSIVLYEQRTLFVEGTQALVDFVVDPKISQLRKNEGIKLSYKAFYPSYIQNITKFSSDSIFINNANLITYRDEKNDFLALDTGETFAEIRYNGLRDTVYFVVEGELLKPNNAPQLLSPSDSSHISITDTLRWSLPDNTEYSTIQISADSNFAEIVYYENVFDTVYCRIDNLQFNKKYYWRVKVIGLGGESDWSEVWMFEIDQKQSINLSSGWNMISSYINPTDLNVENLLEPIQDNLLLLRNNAGELYFPSLGINSIGNWDITQGYKAYMMEEATLDIFGTKIVPEDTPIELPQGWNWIAYLRDSEMSVVTAFEDIVEDILLVRDIEGNIYFPDLNINTLGNLEPSEGYMIYMMESATLTYPANGSPRQALKGDELTPKATYIVPEIHRTGNSMSLVIETESLLNGGEIGIWTQDNVLVGSGKVHEGKAAITVWGDNEQTEAIDGARQLEGLKAMVFDKESAMSYEIELSNIHSLRTSQNQEYLVYNTEDIVMARAVTQSSIQTDDILLTCKPNPTTGETVIEYQVKDQSFVSLKLNSMSGQLIQILTEGDMTSGFHSLNFDGSRLANGVYNLQMVVDGKSVSRLLVISK